MGQLQRVDASPRPSKTAYKVFRDPNSGDISYYPKSLTLLYDYDHTDLGKKGKQLWKITPGAHPLVKKVKERFNQRSRPLLVLLLLLFFLWLISKVTSLGIGLPSFSLPSIWPLYSSRPARFTPGKDEPKYEYVECPDPTNVFDPWNVNAFVPGWWSDEPLPIIYKVNNRKGHKLSIVDIDVKDTRMAVYVDDVFRGVTPDFEPKQGLSCGTDLALCLHRQHSAGVVVISPGKHTVKIEWIGNDFKCNTTDQIEWGAKRERRFMWQREYCG